MVRRKVAVIGAGPSGLAVLHNLATRPDLFELTCFEQAPGLGGVWRYTGKTGVDEHGIPVHSSCYKNLQTKFSIHVMSFTPDHPLPAHLPQYVGHEVVLKYLEDFTSQQDLHKYIQCSKHVQRVNPVTSDGHLHWEVDVLDLSQSSATTQRHLFDIVVVCNGHYAVPRMPTDLANMDSFQGRLLHSHNYKEPEPFKGLRVAVLGRGSSGAEIILDLAPFASKIYWCHHQQPLTCPLPAQVEQLPRAAELRAHSLVVADGREVEVDAVILATGYRFSMPFLTSECHVAWEDGHVKPLYKHIVHTEYSDSLFFIGVPQALCGFPQLWGQSRFLLAVMDGTVTLPSRELMDQDAADDYKHRVDSGLACQKAHLLGTSRWEYHNDLARIANFPTVPAALQNICQDQFKVFFDDIINFRSVEYHVFDVNDPNGFRKTVLPAAAV